MLNMCLLFALSIFVCSCSMFQKNQSSNELESLSKDVLKYKSGIDIEIKPIPK
jgi:hypothetical protein